MQVTNSPTPPLHPKLLELLAQYRTTRDFQPRDYLDKKLSLLHHYFSKSRLNTAVLGVSGGIDSAVCLAMLVEAKNRGLIEFVYPLALPVFTQGAATGQDSATQRGIALCQAFGIEANVLDLSRLHQEAVKAVDQGLGMKGDLWASGQATAHCRTLILNYTTSILTAHQKRAVVIGTTNRDEGTYIGYFGKASDGAVDVQIISDIHKSEVYQLAKLFPIPASIQQVVPTGDMYDGRVDEEVFGTTYDFVELYSHTALQPACLANLSTDAKQNYLIHKTNLENMHRYNAHKYSVGSPAIHLDLYPAGTPGGWPDRIYKS